MSDKADTDDWFQKHLLPDYRGPTQFPGQNDGPRWWLKKRQRTVQTRVEVTARADSAYSAEVTARGCY